MRTNLGAALVLIGLGVTALPVAAQDNPFDTDVDARMGRRVFFAECGRCHGRDGRGNDETSAPVLGSRISSGWPLTLTWAKLQRGAGRPASAMNW